MLLRQPPNVSHGTNPCPVCDSPLQTSGDCARTTRPRPRPAALGPSSSSGRRLIRAAATAAASHIRRPISVSPLFSWIASPSQRSYVSTGDRRRSRQPIPRRSRAFGPALPRRAQPAAARGGADDRGAGAGARRRGDGEDLGADRPPRASRSTTRRAWPSEILSVTFTNKAAREMRERVGRILGEAFEGMPWLGTFHSISRQDAAPPCRAGRAAIEFHDPRHRRSAPALMKQLIQSQPNLDEKRWPARPARRADR